MREFLKRLFITVGYILGGLVGCTIMIGLAILIVNENPIVMFIAKWIIGIPVGIALIIGVISFVYWLFIEPFKN